MIYIITAALTLYSWHLNRRVSALEDRVRLSDFLQEMDECKR